MRRREVVKIFNFQTCMKASMNLLSRSFVFAGLCLGIAGCALDRGEGLSCSFPKGGIGLTSQSTFDPTSTQLLTSMSVDDDAFVPSMRQALQQSIETKARRAPVKPSVKAPIEVEVLALSAGGQYGSFGAGFLRGWSQNPVTRRPKFDLVTGVSAGGMLAPVAFSTSSSDKVLDVFRGLDESGVFKRRGFLALPSSSSFFSAEPLEKTLKSLLTDDLVEGIAEHHSTGARLLVMATNLDTTRAEVFDLGEIASAPVPMGVRRDCITEVMLASAAIPGVFPPRNIDGTLYVDGGLRDQVFLQGIESARVLLAQQTGRPVRVNATIIINGSLKAPADNVKDSLFGYAERSLFTLSDEVLRDSLNETLLFAEGNDNWSVRGVIADTGVEESCPFSEAAGTFDRCVTTELFDAGLKLGKTAPIKFKTSAELRALATEY